MFHRYNCPSAKTFRASIIPEIAGKVREKVKEKIQSATQNGASFSLTTDIWSSLANDSYISITAHFLEGFERQNMMLSVASFNVSHTAENIAAKYEELQQIWGFDADLIFMVLRDNASNMKAAFRRVGTDSFGCLAHTLQV